MTAGRGIVHSEMPEQQEGRMRGFQLWINLPAREKMTAPKYQEFGPERIPLAEPAGGARVKVIAGRIAEVTGPIGQPATDPTYLDIELGPGARFSHPLPLEHSAFVYVYEGALRIGTGANAKRVGTHELAVLGDGAVVELDSPDEAARASGADSAVAPDAAVSRAVLVAGRPLKEPVAKYGPFVMNSREELMQAFADYQSGRF
jgi:redox-sensitive bicupin YhaK (pirin superfamily)